jgi:serine protease AprX
VAAGNRAVDYLVPPASATEAITVGGVDDHNSLDPVLWTGYHSNYGAAYDGKPKPDILAPAVWIAGPIMPETWVAREARWLGQILNHKDDAHMRRLLEKGWADLGIERAQAMEPDEHLYTMIQSRIHSHKLIDAHHQHVDGTSVAAPIVSAVVAQMLEANPSLTPEQIRSILTTTARPLDTIARERQGSGVVNAAAAVTQAYQMLL